MVFVCQNTTQKQQQTPTKSSTAHKNKTQKDYEIKMKYNH